MASRLPQTNLYPTFSGGGEDEIGGVVSKSVRSRFDVPRPRPDQALQSYHGVVLKHSEPWEKQRVFFLTAEKIFLSFSHEPDPMEGLGRDRDGPGH